MRKRILKVLLMALLVASLLSITSCDIIMGDKPSDDVAVDEDHTHSYGAWREVSAPTCTTAGKQERKCLVCSQSEVSDVPATGHTQSASVKENVVGSTCQSEGSYDTVIYCKNCNIEMSRDTVKTSVISHTSDGGVATVTVQSTCTEEGVRTVVESCTVCHIELRRTTESVLALGHSNTTTDEDVLSEPTCSEAGSKRVSVICGVCNDVVSSSTVSIPTIAHKPGETERSAIREATCTSSGTYVDRVSCIVCSSVISETQVTVPKLGHNLSESQTNIIKAPTCTETGRAETYNLCLRCDAKVNKKTTTLSVIEHEAGEPQKVEIPGACEYYEITYCTMCSKEMSNVYVNDETLIHTPGEPVITVTKTATCTSAGKVREDISCTKCGTLISRIESTTEKAPHTAGATTTSTIRAATCQTPGLKRDTTRCSACREVISRVEYEIPTVDHSYGKETTLIVLEPTCTAEGRAYDYKECIWCQDVIVTNEEYALNANGHKTVQTRENQVDSTCTEPGGYDTVWRCKICSEVVRVNHVTFSPKGHTDGDTVTENYLAPTCTARGSYDSVVYCTVCSDEVKRTTTYEDALGHTLADESVIENYVPTTCSKAGTYDEVVYCTVCNDDVTRVEKTIEKLPHTYDFITCTGCGAEVECNEGITFTTNQEIAGKILRQCNGNNCSHDVIYITTYDGQPIVGVDTYAFQNCKATKIIIGKDVAYISDFAFASANIEKIEVDERNQHFKIIGESLYTYDGKTLVRFISTEKADVVIDDEYPSIKSGAFTYTDDVASLTVNGGITYIPYNMFNSSTSLERVIINTELQSIDSRAFYGCSAISELQINARVEEIGGSAFNGCSSLAEVVIPDGILTIGNNAFSDCLSLDFVKFGESLIEIKYGVFENCGTIEKIIIPSTVTKINSMSFYRTVVDSIYFNADEDSWSAISGNTSTTFGNATVYYYLASKPLMVGNYWRYVDGLATAWPPIPEGEGTKGLEYQINDDLLTYTVVGFGNVTDEHIVIPSTYNDMPVVAFAPTGYGYTYKSVVIPDSVTVLGEYAFYNWSYLESVTLSKNITYIPDYAFADCYRLRSVVIPEGVTEIRQAAFSRCSSLVSITLPSTLTGISNAFSMCDNLYEIYNFSALNIQRGTTDYGSIGENARHIYISASDTSGLAYKDGIYYYCDGEICVLVKYDIEGDAIVLPDLINGMTYSVMKYALDNGSATSIYISSGALDFADLQFSLLTMLQYIDVAEDNSVYASHNGILYTKDMSTLITCPRKHQSKDIVIPDGVEIIGDYAFQNVRGVESITLPDSVTTIYYRAFAYCVNLQYVHLGASVEYISSEIFYYDKLLTTVVLPDTLDTIDISAFSNSGITELIIPISVRRINGSLFSGCENVTVKCEAEAPQPEWAENWSEGVTTVIYGYVNEQ